MAKLHDFQDQSGHTGLAVHDDGWVEFGEVGNWGGISRDGGLFVWFQNQTGGVSVRGQVVTPGGGNWGVIKCVAGIPYPAGVIIDGGVADGGWIRVAVSMVAEVLFADGQAPTAGYWVGLSGAVDGRAQVSQSVPDVPTHNLEIGHCLETKNAGTDVRAKVLLHFN